ncbi:hypothetical protein [Nocardiopsis kunsanensis]|uniref:Uncharacterized protein n=1 Tax=Nocardiopsis kunsanensis TaxID=141693 RepID=A0A919CFZ6_9ACTN|nr:hypothetical protein [Nocardiopsis kunsanensis]GHD19733.1 hypothetical protein GCM10007147_10910 [Nocardiopsis kunsanensis]
MVEQFRTAFQQLIDASVAADPHTFPNAVHHVHTQATHVPTHERELALEALTTLLHTTHLAPGITADLTVLAGALVELGTDPGPTGPHILHLLHTVGQDALTFLHAWNHTGGGTPPAPDHTTADAETRVATHLGPHTAPTATMSWWTLGRHTLAARTMLSEPGVRAHIRRDPALHANLMALANQLSPHLTDFDDIRALLRMSEATSALVLHRTTGRAFRILFDGIGDNFQLHTLLADALLGEQGQGLNGPEPDPRWVTSFRDGPTDPDAPTVWGWWNLIAHDGTRVWNEGVPAEIPTVEGERLLVLDPQPSPRSWNAGRRHPHVHGWLIVDSELDPTEADLWWKHTTPAETDPPHQDQPEHTPLPVTTPAPETAPQPQTDHAPQDEPAPQPTEPGRRRAHPALGLPPLPPEVSRSHSWGPTWRH